MQLRFYDIKFYCSQSLYRLIAEVVHLQEKFSRTGDISGGDPLTVKSERRLGNSGKSGVQLERERERELEEACLKLEKALFKTYQDCCLTPFYSRMRYGPAINGADNWGVVKSLEAVKSSWVVKSLGINSCS